MTVRRERAKPVYYTRAQYYNACEGRRILERNTQRKHEEVASLSRTWLMGE